MANFTPEQQDKLKVILGYASMPNLLTTELSEARSQALVDRVTEIIDELAEIDAGLVAARKDSMAKKVGTLELSYAQHVAHLNFDGDCLLKELSNRTGISVIYNKYRAGRGPSTKSYW